VSDLSTYTDDELKQIAGQSQSVAASMSDDDLMKIANQPSSSGPQLVQGTEPTIWDKVTNVFRDKPKEAARATLALVDSETLGINPGTAYSFKDSLDKYYDIDPERKAKKQATLKAIQTFNDTGTEDGWGEAIWKNIQQVPLRMQAAAGRLMQMAEETITPETIKASLGGMSNDEAMEVFKHIARAREEKNVRSIGRDYALEKEKQADALSPNIMPGSFKDVVGQATQSTLNNAVFLLPGFAIGRVAPLALMGAQSFGQTYGEQREAGQEPTKAILPALVNAVAEAGTEFIPTGIYLKPSAGLVKRLIEAELSEITGETVNQIINDVVDKTTIKPGMTLADALENIQTTIQVTALSTLGMTGASHTVNKVIAKSMPDGEMKQTLNEAVKDSLNRGATPQEALKAGMDVIKATPEGQKFVEKKMSKLINQAEKVKVEIDRIAEETRNQESPDLDTQIDSVFSGETNLDEITLSTMPSDALSQDGMDNLSGEGVQTQGIEPTITYVDKMTDDMKAIDAAGLYDKEGNITVLKRENPFTQDWVVNHELGHSIYNDVRPESVAVDMLNNPKIWEQAKQTSSVKSSFIRHKNESYGAEGVDWIEALADMNAEMKVKPENFGEELHDYLLSLQKKSLLNKVKAFNDKLGESGQVDLTPIIDIGRSVWQEGKQTYEEFVARIKEIAGDIWQKIEPYIKDVWNTINNEKGVVGLDIAKKIDMPVALPNDNKDFTEAVTNTPGAEVTEDGLIIDVSRYQKPEQGQMESVRTGVFYLPQKKSPQATYYTRQSNEYGGKEKIEGTTLLKNPIVVKAATGGRAPELAYDLLKGKGAYQKMRTAVLDKTFAGFGKMATVYDIEEILDEYEGDSSLADYILQYSSKGNLLAYAIQENIVANAVRNSGHDAVLSYSKRKGQWVLAELFDVREDKYPDAFGSYSLHPDIEDLVKDVVNIINNEKGSIDLAPLVTLGKSIWSEGSQSLESFTTRAKELLGDTWDKVKDFIKQVWEQVKAFNEKLGERGSFSNRPLADEVKKAGGLDPDKIKSSYNWKDDIKGFGLTNITKKGGVALDDLATELQGKGLLGETPNNYASPGDYLLDMLKQEKQNQVKETITRLTEEEREAIKEIEGQWREEGISEQEINRRIAEAVEITSDKETGGAKGSSKNDLVKKLRELRSVIPTSKVKTIIRRNTGQVSLADLVREDEALYAAFKKAEQAGRAAYRAGNQAGIAEQKQIIKELIQKAQRKAVERYEKNKDIKKIKKLAEMKGDIAVDYQKKIKELMEGYDFKAPTEETKQRLQSLSDYLVQNGAPLGINQKRISEIKRLSQLPLGEMDPLIIKEIRNQLEQLTKLGKLKAQMKFKYKARERAKIEKEILDTTNNIDPTVDFTKDRRRDKIKVTGTYYYTNTLHGPRVTEMFDNFKDNGPQTKLMKMKGRAEQQAIKNARIRNQNFLEFLQNEKIDSLPEGSDSDIRMNIVMRYREGARTQAQTLMDHYKIKNLPTLTPAEEKIVEYIRKDMQDNKDDLVAVFEEVNNEIFPEMETYHLPLKYVGEEELIPDTQVQGRSRTVNTFQGFKHERMAGVKKLPRVGVMKLYEEAVNEQEWYKNIQPVIEDIKSVVLTDEYKEKAGEFQHDWWKDDLDTLARRGWSASAQMTPISTFFSFVRHNINTAILGFKATTVLMQPFAVFDGMAYVNAKRGPKAAARVLAETTKNFLIPGRAADIIAQSEALIQRKGGELALSEEMDKANNNTFKDKATRWAFNLISKADAMTAAGTQEAVRKILIEEGATEKEALEEAEFVMQMSQGDSSVSYRPHILSKGEGYRTWFTFQTFIMNRWGMIIHDLAVGKIAKGAFNEKMLGLLSLGILMMAGASEDEARKWMYELIQRKKLPEDKNNLAVKTFVNLASTAPVFGNILDAAVSKRKAGPPLLGTVMTGAEGAYNIFNGKETNTKIKGGMRATEAGLSIFLGYPGTAQFFDLLESTLSDQNNGGRR